jgi:hypothetical protein
LAQKSRKDVEFQGEEPEDDHSASWPFYVVRLEISANPWDVSYRGQQQPQPEGCQYRLVVYNRFSQWRLPADVGSATNMWRLINFTAKNPFSSVRHYEWTDKSSVGQKWDEGLLYSDRQDFLLAALKQDEHRTTLLTQLLT